MADEFEPRRADAGQEFSYTTNEDVKIPHGDEIPEGVEIIDIDTETGERTGRRFGVQRTIRADADGVIRPKNEEDVRVLDSFGLPVARKVVAAEKAADTKKGEG